MRKTFVNRNLAPQVKQSIVFSRYLCKILPCLLSHISRSCPGYGDLFSKFCPVYGVIFHGLALAMGTCFQNIALVMGPNSEFKSCL